MESGCRLFAGGDIEWEWSQGTEEEGRDEGGYKFFSQGGKDGMNITPK